MTTHMKTLRTLAGLGFSALLLAGCGSNNAESDKAPVGESVHSTLSGCGSVGNTPDTGADGCDREPTLSGSGSCCGDEVPPASPAVVIPDGDGAGIDDCVLCGSGSGGSGDIPPPPAVVIPKGDR